MDFRRCSIRVCGFGEVVVGFCLDHPPKDETALSSPKTDYVASFEAPKRTCQWKNGLVKVDFGFIKADSSLGKAVSSFGRFFSGLASPFLAVFGKSVFDPNGLDIKFVFWA